MATLISKGLRGFAAEAKKNDSYWVETAKLQFSVELDRQRQHCGMQYKAVAEKLGTSPAYVTKVFRGDSNLTIESMVKLARAVGGRLQVSIVDEATAATPKWDANLLAQIFATPNNPIPTATALTDVFAANHERYALAA
jgi:transcriptional regulator with XRE-family HTH domain